MKRRTMDINSDMGESYGNWVMGNDEALMSRITTANAACGFHASDPVTMLKTVRLAKQNGVQIGAHPGLPDLLGFGRRPMPLTSMLRKWLTQYGLCLPKAVAKLHR